LLAQKLEAGRQEPAMRYTLIDNTPKTYVLIFNTGDELADGLARFAIEQKISAASFKAIGALSAVQLGWFAWDSKRYKPSVQFDEQLELLSLIGDIAQKDGVPQVHAHAIVGREDGTAHGRHLMMARVRPTCEVVLVESPAHLQKHFDPESGLALIRV
jgi:uncharacterized protein